MTYLATNKYTWPLVKPITKAGMFMASAHKSLQDAATRQQEEDYYQKQFEEVISTTSVLHGPFKGLRYPELKAMGGALYPKLLGSYESELHGILDKIRYTEYSEIINIGCGEGYYAVGLARMFNDAKVFAFDINQEALTLTNEMAILNDVSDRVLTGRECTSDYLRDFRFTKKGLIVCDCEGNEGHLFNPGNVQNFRNCDLLIETHDFIDISISTQLMDLFRLTHNITCVKSTDDIEKAKTSTHDELKNASLHLKKIFLREGRPAIMEWLFLTPKTDKL